MKYIYMFALCWSLLCSNVYAQRTHLSFLDSLDGKYKFFFLGECHPQKDYAHMHDVLLKLYSSQNVRQLILELPQEYEYGFNSYLRDTGKPDLHKIKLEYDIETDKEQDLYKFLEQLRVYNKSVEDSTQKLSVVCAEITPFVSTGLFKFGMEMKRGNTKSKEIKKAIHEARKVRLFSALNNRDEKTVSTIYTLNKLIDSCEAEFRILYGADFTSVKRRIKVLYKNTVACQNYQVIPDSVRERLIYENIMDAYHSNPQVSYCGLYGLLHTLVNCDVKSFTSNQVEMHANIATRLNETSGLRDQIFTMPYYYLVQDSLSKACDLKYYGKDLLDLNEIKKYNLQIGQNKYLYVPVTNLIREKELGLLFKYVVISKE